MKNNTVYFAAAEPKECASQLMAKSQTFYNFLRSNQYLDKILNMWKFYIGQYNTDMSSGHQVGFAGEQGELVQLPVNHFRNIASHMLNMITSNRPVMDVRAINTDAKSQSQVVIANGILDYYMREQHLEDALRLATEMAIVMGSGFIKLEWNATGGELYAFDPETGEADREGELEFSVLSPLDVVFDGTKERWAHEWLMVRTFQNRYNLMAKYPEQADEIAGLPAKNPQTNSRIAIWSNDSTDDIPVYEFFHKKTESMPEGRYMLFCGNDIILLDRSLPYREIPIYRISGGEILGTPYGYSPMFDIYPLQEAANSLYSTILTNQSAFGVQNVWIKSGNNISINQMEGNMNVIQSDEKPEALNLTQTPTEIFKFLDDIVHTMETISGINSVARGNPEASLKSGTALALVQSMALQFISGLQANYVRLVEDVGTGLLNILKDFANTPKVIAIVGSSNRSLLTEFTGDQLDSVSRVVVDVGNPLSRCLEKGTEVLMFDGSKRKVEDIRIGELVMGPDSKPRTVSNVNSGNEMMYKINSTDKHRKVSYGANESHILTLKYCSDDHRYNAKKGDVIDITIRDYLKLTSRQKRLLQGFKTGVEFQEKELKVPAYILGSWLGDGTSRTTAITSMDQEIVNEWSKYADEIGMQLRLSTCTNSGKAKTYHITSGESHGKSNRNPFMNELRAMELIQNKHIPQYYLTSSREQRLELLAGLLDTDGHRNGETFLFTQKCDRLTNDVIFLAESLGFRVTHRKRQSPKSKLCPNSEGLVNVITIGGNTWEIPNRLPRKQAKEKEKARDWLNYGINVLQVSEGTYYGFTLKEEPHFVLGDFTVTHNTIAGRVQMAEQLAQMKLLKHPQQYFQVMRTGNLDTVTDGDIQQMLLVKRENEKLMEGRAPKAVWTDQHKLHIMEHSSVLADPEFRENDDLVTLVSNHIQEHVNLLRTVDPDLLQLLDQQPLQPPVEAGGNPGQGLPLNNQKALKASPNADLMKPNEGAVNASAQGTIPGSELPNPQDPGTPEVPAGLLPNPGIEPKAS